MFTPSDWNRLFTYDKETDIRTVKSTVALNARMLLQTLGVDETLSTNDFIEALYPRELADQSLAGDRARRKLYEMIGQLAVKGMEDCCVKGEPNGQYMGRPKRPWVWFCPPERDTCPMCGQIMPAEETA